MALEWPTITSISDIYGPRIAYCKLKFQIPVGSRSGKKGEKSRPHMRQIHLPSSVCILYLHQFLSKCKRFPLISFMWYLHGALTHALQGSEPSKGHVVFHLVRASVHWFEILDIKTIELMFLGQHDLFLK